MRAKVRLNSAKEEAAIQRGIAQDSCAQEADADWFARARPATEVLPEHALRRRGPGKKPAKVNVTFRLEPDVAAALRASGPGWQVRAGEALTQLSRGKPPTPLGTQAASIRAEPRRRGTKAQALSTEGRGGTVGVK